MKHIFKILALLVAISAFWIGLLQASVIPESYTWLVSFYFLPLLFLDIFFIPFLKLWDVADRLLALVPKLPLYFIVSLGCYGLLMVGVGLMQFPTCPEEALLLHQDIVEAKDFLKKKGVDVGSD